MRDNRPVYASIRALDDLLDSLPAVSPSRLRQLRAFRGELARALADDGFRPARHSLTALLDVPVLQRYVELAEAGTLRDRLVRGAKPPTSRATNQARRDCLDVLLSAAGRPRLQPATRPWNRTPDTRPAVVLRPTSTSGELVDLRRRLAHALDARPDPGQARFTAMLAMVLDTAARAGELAAMRLDDLDGLDGDSATVEVRRRPQHGTATARPARTEQLPLSALATAALRQWLPAREQLTAPLQGAATALWVSLRSNHTGRLDDHGQATMRPPGLPLQDRGLARAYATGRHRYGLGDLLPPKMEQLRRALDTGPGRP